MANSKISALTSAATIAGTEVLPIVQSSATVKVAISDLNPGLSTITAAKGGTGQTSYAVGDILYASTTTALSKLADVATGNALISGGVSTAPSWGKIGLTTHISGTLAVGNGGTGQTSVTAGYLLYGNGTSALNANSTLQYNSNGSGYSLAVGAGGVWSYYSFQSSIDLGNSGYGTFTARSGIVEIGSNFYIGGGAVTTYKNSSFASWIQFTSGNINFVVAPSGVAAAAIASSTPMTVYNSGGVGIGGASDPGSTNLKVVGNIIQGTAAKGVDFSANTPLAGKTSTLLNWYEEGTWTPNQGAGLTLVGAFSSTGKYTRIGRNVTVSGTVTGATSVAVTAAGVVTTNLPFTIGTAGHGNATNAANTASATVICNTGTTLTSAGAIAATGTITFSATYFV